MEADDNGGVALMINLIPELIKYPNYNYLFISFFWRRVRFVRFNIFR